MNRQKLSVRTLMCLLACTTAACNSDLDQKEIPIQGEGERITVTATADMPQGQPSTRLGFDDTTDASKLKLSWRPIDAPQGPETFSVLSYAAPTTPSTFTMQSVDASGGATFTGEIIPADGSTYYAVYPALTAAATVSATAIPLDMTGQTGTLNESKMYIYGSSTYTTGDALNFDLQHLTSIVKVTLKFPAALAGSAASAVTFTATDGLYTNADADITATPVTYRNPTPGSLALDNTFTLNANAETTVYLHVVSNTLTGFKVMAREINGKSYIGTVTASAKIDAGKMYTKAVDMQEDPLNDAKVGDFYCKDNDNYGYLIPHGATLTEADKKACVGIVYWVGSEALDDDVLLKRDHPNCSHGLVVALQDVGGMHWSEESESVQDWVTNSTYNGVVNLLEVYKMCGYSNTLALMAYNATKGADDKFRVLPCDAILKYSKDKPAPTNSSGWYFHSVMELEYVCYGQGNSSGIAGRDALNTQIDAAGGTRFVIDTYWASTEIAEYALQVGFANGATDYAEKYYKHNPVRPLLAF